VLRSEKESEAPARVVKFAPHGYDNPVPVSYDNDFNGRLERQPRRYNHIVPQISEWIFSTLAKFRQLKCNLSEVGKVV